MSKNVFYKKIALIFQKFCNLSSSSRSMRKGERQEMEKGGIMGRGKKKG